MNNRKEITDNTFRLLSLSLITLFGVYSVLYAFWGERLPVNDGAGWDGDFYRTAIQNMGDVLRKGEFTPNAAQRLLPSFLVWTGLKLTGSETSTHNIVTAFSLLNTLLCLGAVGFWNLICKKTALPESLRFLGIAAMLFSLPLAFMKGYNPVLTDTTAFFLGMMLLYAFISDNNFLFTLALIGGLITWPSATVTVPLLGMFAWRKFNGELKPAPRWQSMAFLFGILLFVIVLCVYVIRHKFVTDMMNLYSPVSQNPALFRIVILSGTATLTALLFFKFRYILSFDWFHSITWFLKNLNPVRIVIIAALMLGWKLWLGTFHHPAGGATYKFFLLNIFRHHLFQPLSDPLNHVLYYGPVVFLMIWHWKKMSTIAMRYGPGFLLFFLSQLFFSIDPETRHALFFMPFLLLLCMTAIRESGISLRMEFWIPFLLLAFVGSRIWFHVNTPDFVWSVTHEGTLSNPVHQRYFMYFGCFMDYKHFLIQSLTILACAALFIPWYHRLQMRARMK